MNLVQVAVGIIFNSQREVLVAKRAPHLDQGDLWEFPGGKFESGETAEEALKRELFEEIGIVVESAKSLLQINYNYPHKQVFLDVWEILQFTGVPYAKENQSLLEWISLTELPHLEIPAANQAIVCLLLEKFVIRGNL